MRQVIQLRPIDSDIVKFKVVVIDVDQFPVANTNRVILSVERKINRFMWLASFAVKNWFQTQPAWRCDLFTFHLGWVTRLSQVQTSRHDVDQVPGLRRDGSFVFDSVGPIDDHWRSDTAFVLVLLVLAERRVAGVSPAMVVAPIGFGIPRHQVFFDRLFRATLKWAGTIVVQKHD